MTPRLVKFIDNLTNWYVRMNRKRLRGEIEESGSVDGDEKRDLHKDSLEILAIVITTMVELMAPFTPFLTELMYQNLKKLYLDRESDESLHYIMLPEANENLINKDIELSVGYMQTIINVGRILRDRRTLPIKKPLPELIVISKDQSVLDKVNQLKKEIEEELNIKNLKLTTDRDAYQVVLKAEPNIKALGLRLRNKSKDVVKAIRELKEQEIAKFVENPADFSIVVGNENVKLEEDEMKVIYSFSEEKGSDLKEIYEAHAEGQFLIILDVRQDSSMKDEGCYLIEINLKAKN